MGRNKLVPGLVAVAMMAIAWMVVAFFQATRVEEPSVDGEAGGERPGGGEASSRAPGVGEGPVGAAPAVRRVGSPGTDSPGKLTASRGPGVSPGADVGDDPTEAEGEEDCVDCAVAPWPLTADGIRGAVAYRKDEFKECYEAWLKLDPEVAGTVVVTFTVAAAEDDIGRVTTLELADSELDHPFIEGCVLNVFQELAFDPPADGGEVEVNYPLMFDTGAGEEPAEDD